MHRIRRVRQSRSRVAWIRDSDCHVGGISGGPPGVSQDGMYRDHTVSRVTLMTNNAMRVGFCAVERTTRKPWNVAMSMNCHVAAM